MAVCEPSMFDVDMTANGHLLVCFFLLRLIAQLFPAVIFRLLIYTRPSVHPSSPISPASCSAQQLQAAALQRHPCTLLP